MKFGSLISLRPGKRAKPSPKKLTSLLFSGEKQYNEAFLVAYFSRIREKT